MTGDDERPVPGSGSVAGVWLRRAVYLGVAAGVVVLLLAAGKQGASYLPAFAQWVQGQGIWGPLVFIAGYVLATVAFVPGSLLTLAAGALFGLVRGTLYVFIGATLGACAAFLVGRYVARGAIEQRIAAHPQFNAIDGVVGREGRKIVFLLRLSPVFPFNLLNYALGLTRVRFLDYLVACIGMLPGTFLYVYYGHTAGSLASAISGGGVEKGPEYWLVLALGLAATVVVSVLVARRARRALKEAADV